AEVFDPALGNWSPAGSMSVTRSFHGASSLSDGRVLVTGGDNGTSGASADLYDPTTGRWSAARPMTQARYVHASTVMSNGTVMVAGGEQLVSPQPVKYLSSAELYE